MKFSQCVLVFVCTIISYDKAEAKEDYLSMIGHAYTQHQLDLIDNDQLALMMRKKDAAESQRVVTKRGLNKKSKKSKHNKKQGKSKSESTQIPSNSPSSNSQPCNPEDVNLLDYPQWQEEKGYWLGEYTLLGGDGDPFKSAQWNYPYDHYKGFITGNISGNKYRQRNVFLYPPQKMEICSIDNTTVGDGVCGVNGHSKVFSADQAATTCSDNEELFGDIEGPYAGLHTKTELIGEDNALLYQVLFPAAFAGGVGPDRLLQSQLTTLTYPPGGQVLRTRTAQTFGVAGPTQGVTTSAAYYRERKVDKETFYSTFQAAIEEYNIRDEDMCANEGGSDGAYYVEGVFGIDVCIDHLEESNDKDF